MATLALAKAITKAELSAPDGPPNRAFTAAVFRICCATAIGALIGAPLGALAANEDILLKMAEAAVVIGLGATTAEVIQPLSVKLIHDPAPPPPDVSDYHLAMTAIHDLQHEVNRSTAPALLTEPELRELQEIDAEMQAMGLEPIDLRPYLKLAQQEGLTVPAPEPALSDVEPEPAAMNSDPEPTPTDEVPEPADRPEEPELLSEPEVNPERRTFDEPGSWL
jgi:hypothetical protein